ncbi:fungal-specific transcription factor domain-containing protein [Aspergillus floccosus]
MLNDLFKVMRAEDESYGLRLLEVIRQNASPEEIRAFIDQALTEIDGTTAQRTVQRLEEVRRTIDIEGARPSFRPKVMDIHFLCDEVPYLVPAQPWTAVTDDSELVSHLVSLYFTWDYPFHSFLDREVFLAHMSRGDRNSDFCSPFLVNALLANACHFSDYSEAYVLPGDIVTKGADFLAEAERLRESDTAKLSLAYLQGTLLLYERYSISGNNDLGYKRLHQAIRTGESLGLIGPLPYRMTPAQLSDDMEISIRRTAWGLFHIDTIVHADFLRPSLINQVNVPRPDRTQSTETELWAPYPSHRPARPSYLSQYFDESCNLCEIARDISRSFGRTATSAERKQIVKEALYERLCRWYDALPDIFGPGNLLPPYVNLLKMRFHTLVITLLCYSSPPEDTEMGAEVAPQTPESPVGFSPVPKYNETEIVLASARGISSLVRVHRQEFGMNRAHHFALYATNLALFTLLKQGIFDILDPDFLSLASAFASMASRSQLGRSLFHMFRQLVRAKGQGQRIRDSTTATDEMRALFGESIPYTPWDEYGKGLAKLEEDERYHGIGNERERTLVDMLDRYESLSLGKDEIAPERFHPG